MQSSTQMNRYTISSPSSRQVSGGRDEQGNRQTTVTHRGGGSVGNNLAYTQAMGVANANIEPMLRSAELLANRINARKTTVNPRTGELDYVHTEEERKND